MDSSTSTEESAEHCNILLDQSNVLPSSNGNSDDENLNAQLLNEPRSLEIKNFKKPEVQVLNIQLLDTSKVDAFISHGKEKFRKYNFQSYTDYVEKFIQVYNKIKLKEEDFKYEFQKSRDVGGICQRTYKRVKTMLPSIVRSEDKNPNETISSIYILFFFPKIFDSTMDYVFAATTCEAWEAIRPYADYSFPIKIIERVGSPDDILRIERRYLFKSSTKEILLKPSKEELHKTSSLFYLVENLICEIDKSEDRGGDLCDYLEKVDGTIVDADEDQSSGSEESSGDEEESSDLPKVKDGSNNELDKCLPPPRKKVKYEKKFNIKITTAGSVSIQKKLKVRDVIGVIKLFNIYLSDDRPTGKRFDFLHFFKIARNDKSTLDDALIADIFDKYKNNKPQYVDVQHKYYEEFLLSNSYGIEIDSKKKFKDIGSVAPDIYQIIDEITNSEDVDEETFRSRMKKRKLRFNLRNGRKKYDRIIDYMEGELFFNDQNYFKIRKLWYHIGADYLSLLQQDFEKVMDEVFIETVAEGSLPTPWIKNIPFRQNDLQNYLQCKQADVKELVQQLSETKVYYIFQGKVMQKGLVGEILKKAEVRKYKTEIECVLEELSGSINEVHFISKMHHNKATISAKDLKIIWKELIAARKVLSTKKSSTYVANPFPYPLKENEHYEALTQYLTKICKNDQLEEDYNRSYLDFNDSHKMEGGHKYLVFDQICPDGIEPCDILSYTADTKSLYLYHVKEKFGQHTREVCSQILNSATRVQEALRTNQEDHYLKSLWNKAKEPPTNEKDYEWRNKLKAKLDDLGEEDFLKMFRDREIVFVYGYRVPTGFKKSHERDKITDSKIQNACKRSGFVTEKGFLTTKFFHTTKKMFPPKLRSKDQSIKISKCDEAYDILKKRVFSESTIAKMEIIRLEEKLRTFQNRFKLKICEIPTE